MKGPTDYATYLVTAWHAHIVLVGGWWAAQTLAVLDLIKPD